MLYHCYPYKLVPVYHYNYRLLQLVYARPIRIQLLENAIPVENKFVRQSENTLAGIFEHTDIVSQNTFMGNLVDSYHHEHSHNPLEAYVVL